MVQPFGLGDVACLSHRPILPNPNLSSNGVPDAQSQTTRLQYLSYQLAYHFCLRIVHRQFTLLDVGLRENNQRFLTSLISQIWRLPLLVALGVLPARASHWVRWALSVLLVGALYVHTIDMAITSRNAGSVCIRIVASAQYNMFMQASSVIGSNVSHPPSCISLSRQSILALKAN